MRLIIATSSFPTYPDEAINAGVFVWAVAQALEAQGHKVWVFTPDKGESIHGFSVPVVTFEWGGSEKVLTRLNPRLPQGLWRLGRLMLQGRSALKRLVRRIDADGIIAMWAIPAGFWSAGADIPFVVWALGSDIWSASRYPLGIRIVRNILHASDHVFANSYYLMEKIKSMANTPVEFLSASRCLPVDSTPAVDLSPNQKHFLFIGRWDLAKAPLVLLEAMSEVGRHLSDVHLHLFGGGPLEKKIRQRVSQPDLQDIVTIHGYANPETATAYLKACDALVISSRIESVPVLFSDALMCGCPIISTEVGDLGRLVRDCHVGLLCPPENPMALAKAMMEIIDEEGKASPRQRYNEALKQASSRFSPHRSANRCIEVLFKFA
jgi:glycosyltransferase involved in cell wall biosynthesis